MSKRRREEKRKERKKIIWGLSLIAAVVLIVGGILFYQKFIREKGLESFIPENPTSFMLIDINPDSQQNLALEKLAMNLGNENIFKEYLEGQFFKGLTPEDLKIDEEDLKSWLGQKLVISKIQISSREYMSAHVVEIKNLEKVQEVLGTINENLKKRGNIVTTEEFRGSNIVSVEGENDIAYALYGNFLLISENPSGVKTMLDTAVGRNKSLSSDRIYNRFKRKLRGNDYVVFAFIDLIKTLQYISGYTNNVNFSFIDKIAPQERINMGAVFTAKETGVEMEVMLGGNRDSYEKKKGFEPNLASFVPSDLSLYIEGQDAKSLIENVLVGGGENLSEEDLNAKLEVIKRGLNLQFGIDMDKDILEIFSGRYAFMLFPFKEGKGLSAGIIIDSKKGIDANDKMKKIEEIAANEINKNLIKDENEKIAFFDREYKNYTYRFAKLPDNIKLDIFYAVLQDKIIITTSKTALTKLIDSASKSSDKTLADSINFKNTYKKIDSKDATRLIFVDLPKSFEFLDNFEYLKYTKVQDEYRKLEGLGILNQYSTEGGRASGFLSIMEKK